jgi:hypothetical protein
MTREIERVEVVLVYTGDGPELARRKVATFLRPEKIAALRTDPGVLGALLRPDDPSRS